MDAIAALAQRAIPSLSPDALARALDYPYDVASTHFAIDPNGRRHRLLPDLVLRHARQTGNAHGATLYDVDIDIGSESLTLRSVAIVIAAGSNAAPTQLIRKFGGRLDNAIHVASVTCHDVVPAYSAHFAGYGAVAACLLPHPGAVSQLFVTLLDPDALELMHATESLGINYRFARHDGPIVGLPPSDAPLDIYYYESLQGPLLTTQGHPILLSAFEVEAPGLRRLHQTTLLPQVLYRLFPDRTPQEALAALVADGDLRAEATSRLADLRIDPDRPAPQLSR